MKKLPNDNEPGRLWDRLHNCWLGYSIDRCDNSWAAVEIIESPLEMEHVVFFEGQAPPEAGHAAYPLQFLDRVPQIHEHHSTNEAPALKSPQRGCFWKLAFG